MDFPEFIDILNQNPLNVSIRLVNFLIKTISNILNRPDDRQLRSFDRINQELKMNVLDAKEGEKCLAYIGFRQDGSRFVLSEMYGLKDLEKILEDLLMWMESISPSDPSDSSSPSTSEIKISSAPARYPTTRLNSLYSHPFLHKIEVQFHNALRYKDLELRLKARKLIPIENLERAAADKQAAICEYADKNKTDNCIISLQELQLLELLGWFKEEFMTWVNSPPCQFCGGKTEFSHIAKEAPPNSTRAENHKCVVCHQFTLFIRYDDLNILLETRKGRCGEWANVFTLFCISMGWDARFVVDETDHVWTEVYSVAQERWLHCDPCENTCDKPLMYEVGWKKKLSYIMAYSHDDIQDVTWRYTSNFRGVMERRTKCSEEDLASAITELRRKRQVFFTEPYRNQLLLRTVRELADMLTEKKPGSEEYMGRSSGDVLWRLARGEVQENQAFEPYIWQISMPDRTSNRGQTVTLKYSIVQNRYRFYHDDCEQRTVERWAAGCFNQTNIRKHEEKDWKQVYLARQNVNTEKDVGKVTWKFQLDDDSARQLYKIVVKFDTKTFDNGHIDVQLSSDGLTERISNDGSDFETTRFLGKNIINLEATLSGGKGDIAWQHAQLFRQPSEAVNNYPFVVKFYFNK